MTTKNSAVGIATRYGLDSLGFESRQAKEILYSEEPYTGSVAYQPSY